MLRIDTQIAPRTVTVVVRAFQRLQGDSHASRRCSSATQGKSGGLFQVAARALLGERLLSRALRRGWPERRRYDASVAGLSIPWLIKVGVTSHDDTLKCCAASSMKSSSGTLDPK